MSIVDLSFPFARGQMEYPGKSYDASVIEQNIRRIIRTRKRERVMRPGTGSLVSDFAFEGTGIGYRERLRETLRRDIQDGEPRAVIEQIGIFQRERKDSKGVETVAAIIFSVLGERRAVAEQLS